MPIYCPECYASPPVAVADEPTKVRCESCGHVWDPLKRGGV